MREWLLAILVATAPLAWCESARAQILAEAPISISGWRSGEPARSVQIVVSFDDLQRNTEDPKLFDSIHWTQADVGRVVSIGSFLDDPDFPAARDTLINGLDGLVSVQVAIEPGGGGPGTATLASSLFADALRGAVDFAGSQIDAIALRLDSLSLNDPSDGSASLQFTLLLITTGVGSDSSVEFWQCRNDLDYANYQVQVCTEWNRELNAAYESMLSQYSTCDIALSDKLHEISQLNDELAQAQWDLEQAKSAASGAQAALALAQAQLLPTQEALAAATADSDGDGVRDSADACPGSATGATVDRVGCTQAQFCSAIDISAGHDRSICTHSDWRNDEPLADNPGDCKANGKICEAVSF